MCNLSQALPCRSVRFRTGRQLHFPATGSFHEHTEGGLGWGGGRECRGTEGWIKLESRVGQAEEVEGQGTRAPLQVMAKYLKGNGKLLEDTSSIHIYIDPSCAIC